MRKKRYAHTIFSATPCCESGCRTIPALVVKSGQGLLRPMVREGQKGSRQSLYVKFIQVYPPGANGISDGFVRCVDTQFAEYVFSVGRYGENA